MFHLQVIYAGAQDTGPSLMATGPSVRWTTAGSSFILLVSAAEAYRTGHYWL